MIPGFPMGLSKSVLLPAAQGQQIFENTGTFIVPDRVYSICMVCVAQGSGHGGALAYTNNVAVTPGQSVYVRDVSGNFEIEVGGIVVCRAQGHLAEDCIGDVANSGGLSSPLNQGGGGAAGYSGNGGDGATGWGSDGSPGSGGGGGGGAGDGTVNNLRGHGGGVGLKGEGFSGAGGDGGSSSTQPALQGSGGSGGSGGNFMSGGGTYGGGAGRSYYDGKYIASPGPGGARIIWGPGRSYPNNAQDV